MAMSGWRLVAPYILSSCSQTREEHEYLIEKLLTLCEGDRNCVSDNMNRMQELCSLAKENNIVKFGIKCKKYANKYGVSDNTMIDLISETFPNLPRSYIEDKYQRSQNAYDVLQNLKKKETWNAWITIKNKSDFPDFGTNPELFIACYPPHKDDGWALILQIIEDVDAQEGQVVYHFNKEFRIFRENGKLSNTVKKTIRDIFENKFIPEDDADNDSKSVKVGKLIFEFTDIFVMDTSS